MPLGAGNGYRATIARVFKNVPVGALPACCSITSELSRSTRVNPVLRRRADRYPRRGSQYFVRERVPAISGNEGQTALLFFLRKGAHVEHGASADAFLSSHSLKAYGFPERISYGYGMVWCE